VYNFILSVPPAFSLFEPFALPLIDLCLMFYHRSKGHKPYKREGGVCHGDDLMYLFHVDFTGFPPSVETKDQKKTQNRLLDIVTSFMLDGKPKMRDCEQNYWPPMQKNGSKFRYMDLNVHPVMRENDTDLWKHLNFWREIRKTSNLNNWNFVKKRVSKFFPNIAVNRANFEICVTLRIVSLLP